jgi:peptidoglycan/xylan/chitin deacetylase (PgdA/CDA1 family)
VTAARVLVLTYHAVEPGPPPLCLEPALFRAHLGVIAASGARALTVSQLAAGLRAGELPQPAVAITFDDGAASVARAAAGPMREHGLTGTVFCVAAHLGGRNDWPSEPRRSPPLRLAGPEELAELSRQGWEIGSHGLNHVPLDGASGEAAEEELAGSRRRLEEALGRPVTSFAYPYGLAGPGPVRDRVAEIYEAACTARLAHVRRDSHPLALPRVDAHYLRRPELLRRALAGSGRGYLRARRAGARARRMVLSDHAG